MPPRYLKSCISNLPGTDLKKLIDKFTCSLEISLSPIIEIPQIHHRDCLKKHHKRCHKSAILVLILRLGILPVATAIEGFLLAVVYL
jgi:hypothetical protein